MKIIHIFDHSFPLQDGYSARSLAILQQQVKRGWKVFPLTGPRQGSLNEDNEVIFDINFFRTKNKNLFFCKIPFLKHFWTIWLIYKRLISIVHNVKPDVLHAHSPALNGIAAIFAGKHYRIPVIYEVRAFWEDAAVDQKKNSAGGLRYKMTRYLENYVFRNVQQVTTICEGLKKDIDSRNVCSRPVVVIPNAVEFDRFSKLLPRQQDIAFEKNLFYGFTLGFIGSFYDYEGLDLAIRAMPLLLKKNPAIRLLLVGTGLQDQILRNLAVELKVDKEVVFTGKIPFSEVERYYSVIDLLVYPRKLLRLTDIVTPLKPLEAMAQGKVFIASDVGGHRELVRHGETGILFKADCLDAFVDAVLYVLCSKELRNKLKKNGIEFVRNERNWANSVENYVDIYPK